jgi:hypothetical protein
MKRHPEPFAVWHAKRRGLQVFIAVVVSVLCVVAILAVALG